jgi:TrmH family RNA methyltransferase
MINITSLQNPKVKQVVKLRERRERDALNLFLIEGYRELSRAQHVEIETLFFSPDHFLGSNERALIDHLQKRGAQILEVLPSVFEKMSYRDRPDGLLAVARKWHSSLADIEKRGRATTPFLLVAEAIEKPGNLGTILRSCDAVGVDGVVVCDRCTDIFNPNVVRASVGTLFTQPVVETSTEEILLWLKKNGIKIVATTPAAQEVYTRVDLTGPIALAVGTEQLGLSKTFLDQADIQVRIPMRGVADSLNVASATTLILYEALRQRDESPLSR